MPKTLPAHPHIDWLKKTAKQQLDELRARDPSARLHQAQLAVARDYGFASWRALKAHVDAQSVDGQIIAAARQGRAGDLDALLAHHPRKIDITGSDWDRPLLHIAAGEGHLDCVDVLLRRGFDVATRDRGDNATALHWAAQFGTLAVVERLLEAGADIDGAGDAHEVGVIGWATCFQQVRREVADHLLARGARPTIFAAVALDRADLVRSSSPPIRRCCAAQDEPLRASPHAAASCGAEEPPRDGAAAARARRRGRRQGQPRLHAAQPRDREDRSGDRRRAGRGRRRIRRSAVPIASSTSCRSST